MNQEIINFVMYQMNPHLDNQQLVELKEYLDSRKDDNLALFVGLRAPNDRLEIGGVKVSIRKFGKNMGIKKCHPHKFRRTMATVAIGKGMPIEQVLKLLGMRRWIQRFIIMRW